MNEFLLNVCTVEPPLADTSHKWTLSVSGHETAVSVISPLKL